MPSFQASVIQSNVKMVDNTASKAEIKSSEFDCPSLFLFDGIPGGVGLAEKTYDLWPRLLLTAFEVIGRCPCVSGCPACVGPRVGGAGKAVAERILKRCSGPSS